MGGLSALAEPQEDKGGQAAHGTPKSVLFPENAGRAKEIGRQCGCRPIDAIAKRVFRSKCYANALLKYSLLPSGSGFIVSPPSCQLAGQTSPCSSWNCSALTIRRASPTLRPSGRSLTT